MQRPFKPFPPKFFGCLALLLLTACADPSDFLSPESNPNVRAQLGLRGPVKALRTTTQLFETNAQDSSILIETTVETREFNREGILLRHLRQRDGITEIDRTITLNVHGATQKEHEGANELSPPRTTEVRYGPNGKLQERQIFNPEKELQERELREYDTEGRLSETKQIFYQRDGSGRETHAYRTAYEYDSANQLRVKHTRNEIPVFESEYNTDDQLLEHKLFDEDGKWERTLIYRYEGDTVGEERNVSASGKLLGRKRVERGPYGKTLDAEYDAEGNLVYRQEVEYLDLGWIAAEQYWGFIPKSPTEERPAPEAEFNYLYILDTTGNWNIQEKWDERSLRQRVEREFTYFE